MSVCLSVCLSVRQGGFYLFNIVDSSVGGFPLLVIGVFEIISVVYIYGKLSNASFCTDTTRLCDLTVCNFHLNVL